MRILAFTRSDDAAWESPLTKQGLPNYVLLKDGFIEKRADLDPSDKKIILSEWLKYGVKREPELYTEMSCGRMKRDEDKVGKLTAYWKGVSGTTTLQQRPRPALGSHHYSISAEKSRMYH